MIWADLRDGMVVVCSLRTDYDERIIESSTAGVWMERTPFDVHICKFETEQWLNSCYIDLAAYRLFVQYRPDSNRIHHRG